MPNISVIIPCYNVAPYIERCLNSLQVQTFADFEIIIVNDGSTDNLIEILEQRKSEKVFQWTYLYQSNQGSNAARNAGIEAANGQYLLFLDADDELLPEMLERVYSLVISENADVAVCGYKRVNENKEVIKQVSHIGKINVWEKLMLSELSITSAMLWKKETVQKCGKWTVGLKSSQEYDLCFRVLKKAGKIAILPEILTMVHARSGSISIAGSSENWSRFLLLRQEIYLYLLGEPGLLDIKRARSILFSAVRNTYPHNKNLALQVYKRHLNRFVELNNLSNVSHFYGILLRLFGFRITEKIRKIFG